MTTSNSPIHQIRAQAKRAASELKKASYGGSTVPDPAGKIADSLMKGTVKFGIVMDDKVITVEMPWSQIRATDEVALVEWIVEHMRGKVSK